MGKALSGDGTVSLRLADTTVEVKVPDHVRVEAELEVDGDEVELEIELKWSTARTVAKAPRKNGGAGRDGEDVASFPAGDGEGPAAGQAAGTPETPEVPAMTQLDIAAVEPRQGRR